MKTHSIFNSRARYAFHPAGWALLLRLANGFGLLFHGYAKLSRGPQNFGKILAGLHLPLPVLLAWLTTVTELAGGAAIAVGAFVLVVVAVPVAVVLLVAIVTVHLPNGFDGIRLMGFGPDGLKLGKPGFDLIDLAGLAALALGGAGPWSIDGRLAARVSDSSLARRI